MKGNIFHREDAKSAKKNNLDTDEHGKNLIRCERQSFFTTKDTKNAKKSMASKLTSEIAKNAENFPALQQK